MIPTVNLNIMSNNKTEPDSFLGESASLDYFQRIINDNKMGRAAVVHLGMVLIHCVSENHDEARRWLTEAYEDDITEDTARLQGEIRQDFYLRDMVWEAQLKNKK